MLLFRGNRGLDFRFYVREPENAHPWAEPRVLAYYALKSVQYVPLALASCKNPKKTSTFLVRKVTHAQKRYAWADCDEHLHRCRVHDLITSANFYDCRLWGLNVVGVKFWVSPLTRVVALTTLSHYRASV